MFQCLLIGGENQGEDALRNAEKLVVTDEQFESFLKRHSRVASLVPESNLKVLLDTFIIINLFDYTISKVILNLNSIYICTDAQLLFNSG